MQTKDTERLFVLLIATAFMAQKYLLQISNKNSIKNRSVYQESVNAKIHLKKFESVYAHGNQRDF